MLGQRIGQCREYLDWIGRTLSQVQPTNVTAEATDIVLEKLAEYLYRAKEAAEEAQRTAKDGPDL